MISTRPKPNTGKLKQMFYVSWMRLKCLLRRSLQDLLIDYRNLSSRFENSWEVHCQLYFHKLWIWQAVYAMFCPLLSFVNPSSEMCAACHFNQRLYGPISSPTLAEVINLLSPCTLAEENLVPTEMLIGWSTCGWCYPNPILCLTVLVNPGTEGIHT